MCRVPICKNPPLPEIRTMAAHSPRPGTLRHMLLILELAGLALTTALHVIRALRRPA